MPLLAKETALFPEDLLSSESTAAAQPWWVAYTRSRREKDLMRRLLARQVAFYCPLHRHRSVSPAGRARSAWLPLFSNYVFVRGDADARLAAVQTNCVSRMIAVDDQETLAGDLRRLEAVLQSGEPVVAEERLLPGDAVRVVSGPIRGLEGTVIRRDGRTRLLVAVEFLQQGASVSVDLAMVRKA